MHHIQKEFNEAQKQDVWIKTTDIKDTVVLLRPRLSEMLKGIKWWNATELQLESIPKFLICPWKPVSSLLYSPLLDTERECSKKGTQEHRLHSICPGDCQLLFCYLPYMHVMTFLQPALSFSLHRSCSWKPSPTFLWRCAYVSRIPYRSFTSPTGLQIGKLCCP